MVAQGLYATRPRMHCTPRTRTQYCWATTNGCDRLVQIQTLLGAFFLSWTCAGGLGEWSVTYRREVLWLFLSQNTYISLKSYSTKRVLPFVVAVEPGESMMARYGLWRMADRSRSTLVGLSGWNARVTRIGICKLMPITT